MNRVSINLPAATVVVSDCTYECVATECSRLARDGVTLLCVPERLRARLEELRLRVAALL